MDIRQELTTRPDGKRQQEIVQFIGNDPSRFAELIDLVLCDDRTVSQYASWLISHCMKDHPGLIQPHLPALISNLERRDNNDSVIRSTVKALANTSIPERLKGYALQHCFDILLDVGQPVSIQVHAMQTVFNLSQEEPDLLRELKMILEERMPTGTAGYKARSRNLIKKIDRLLSGRRQK